MMLKGFVDYWAEANAFAEWQQRLHEEQKNAVPPRREHGAVAHRNIFEITSEDTSNDNESGGIHHCRLGK